MSWHHNRVAGQKFHVFTLAAALNDRFVVDVETLAVGLAENVHLALLGELGGAPCAGDELDDGDGAGYGIGSRTLDLAGDVNELAMNFGDEDGGLGVTDIGGEALVELLLELGGGGARDLELVDEREGDLAVRADGDGPGELRLAPDGDLENVAVPDLVVGVDAVALGEDWSRGLRGILLRVGRFRCEAEDTGQEKDAAESAGHDG